MSGEPHRHLSRQDLRLFLQRRLSPLKSRQLLRQLMAGCPVCLRRANEVLDEEGPLGIETEALGTPWKLDG